MRKTFALLTLLLVLISGCTQANQPTPEVPVPPPFSEPPPVSEPPLPSTTPAPLVKTGLEVLLSERLDLLEGKRVGLITNPTGLLPDLTHAVDALHQRANLVAAFGPEHGVRGTAQAGEQTGDLVDPKTGVPFFSIYGKGPAEIAELFDKTAVDLVLFDIQDVGARFYTYIWTLYHAMEAAAQTGVELVVLDRPNPTGGLQVEGPVLDPPFATFVGLKPIAQRHGLTVGELALLFNGEFLSNRVDLTVVALENWDRAQLFTDTRLPWVLPSPNMPTPATALVYSGTGLIEGTNLSEGRGTTKPFELIGAPYIDHRLAEALNELELPGVAFREAYFTPTFSKYAGETVGGVELFVSDPTVFEPIRTALHLIKATMELYPDQFAWRDDNWIDKLTGSDRVRTMLDAGKSVDEIVASWQEELDSFKAIRQKYLLY